jgi:GT2 family glycosyltransferase
MTTNQSISLSIIIVNYRSAQLIVDCLRSVYRYNQLPMEIIVVDNEPGGKGRDMVAKDFPRSAGSKWATMLVLPGPITKAWKPRKEIVICY